MPPGEPVIDAEDEQELRAAIAHLQSAARETDDHEAVRWALVGATAGVYLWNVLDALGAGQQSEPGDLSWSVAPAVGGGYVCATWSVR